MNHSCIKPGCTNTYQDEEVDPYYCSSCNTERRRLAKEMDGKFNTVGQQPNSGLAAYDAARGTSRFPRASMLGL